MRKLVIALSVLAAAGCSATRRDFAYCDSAHTCGRGYSCNLLEGICVLGDAGLLPADAPLATEVGPADVLADLPIETTVADAPADLAQVADGSTNQIDQAAVDVTSPGDGPAVDLSQLIDRPTPDTRVPDAAGTCSVDNDCIGLSKSPYCVNDRCVSCAASAADGGSLCSGATPVCNQDTGACVACLDNSDCKLAGKSFCAQNKCVGCDDPGARASSGSVDGGSDDGGTAATTACLGDTVCMSSTAGSSKAGQCVACRDDSDCTGSTPICDTAKAFTCGACSNDDQCTRRGQGPGVCMFVKDGTFQHDGTCASDAEAIYVQNSSGCSGGQGTAASPFCQPQLAISAVTASKRVIVLSGTAPLAVWTASLGAGAQPLYVVGKNNPTISVGAADTGIHVTSGSVYVRGITVQGVGASSVNPGIVVDAGAIIGLDRCYVMGNAGGLLANDGAGFDVANSVFAQNQRGSAGAAFFGGVYLGSSTSASLPHRFWFNTVADNQYYGLACTSKQQTIDGCLLWNDQNGEVVNCTLAATTKSPNRSPSGTAGSGFSTDTSSPIFDPSSTAKPYHLTGTNSRSTSSPCKDFITDPTILFPPDDIDGQSRPNGTAADCGADEYWP